jgi:hypothetical protein
MVQQEQKSSNNASDGKADVIAVVAIITLVVGAVVYWLHGL